MDVTYGHDEQLVGIYVAAATAKQLSGVALDQELIN